MRGDLLVLLRDTGGAVFVQVEDQRVTGLAINGTSVDITNKDSNQWREMIAAGGIASMTLNVEGVYTASAQQQAMRDAAMDRTAVDWQIDDSVQVTEGAFQVNSFEVSGSHDGEQTYTATLENVDEPVVT